MIDLCPSRVRASRARPHWPKLYFYDTGLACGLLDIENHKHIAQHPLGGALVENWVFSELIQGFLNLGRNANMFSWRTHGGEDRSIIQGCTCLGWRQFGEFAKENNEMILSLYLLVICNVYRVRAILSGRFATQRYRGSV
ncbi:MAG: DUF4143 domain-containing protein [Phycisphaerae bacterium]|nr:DUF4143 domain-containing protein [Planctomycetota bacterium]MBL7221444.1 DUF4143 domain-containing protein [Phycisphaerae bacterium]